MSERFAATRSRVLSLMEVDAMPKAPYEGSDLPRPRPRRRRRRRHGEARVLEPAAPSERPSVETDPVFQQASELENIDVTLLSGEERAYLEARRRAEQKVELYRELVKAGLIVVPLLVFIPFAGVIALILSGMRLGRRFYRVMIEPGVRERLVAEEVSKRLDASVLKQRREIEGEHARSLEELSASIAHEIRNPITAAKSLVQQMGEEPGSNDNVEYARVALGELERVERSVSHLLRFARDEELRAQTVAMADVLDSALETFRERAVREGVAIERRFDTQGLMRGDPEKLRRVAINLVGNALDAMADARSSDPALEISLGENLAGTEVWVRVRDNGPGIDAEARDKIFNPFFTKKQSGTGLGLPITKKLVEAHGGEIELVSPVGAGSEFVLTFPKDGDASTPDVGGGVS